ncbi:MAG: ferritin family protein [Nitrospirota bacterium]
MELETLFDIFKVAIDKEHEAYEFYSKAAATTSNIDAKKLFEEFAQVELHHEKRLKEKYAELRKAAS